MPILSEIGRPPFPSLPHSLRQKLLRRKGNACDLCAKSDQFVCKKEYSLLIGDCTRFTNRMRTSQLCLKKKATKLKVSIRILLIQHGVHGQLELFALLLQTKLKETRWKKRPLHERNAKSSMLRYWCRRKQLLLIMLSIITLINPPRDRICWMRPHSDDWFILADSMFNREQWYENLLQGMHLRLF